MVIYIVIVVLLYFLAIAVLYFIKGIPKNFYLAKGKIIKWDKKRGDSNLIEYFPVIEYNDKKGNRSVVELKDQSAGWIKPRLNYKVFLLVNEDGARLLSNALSQSLLSLISIVIIVVLIVVAIGEL